ncbi:MAG TPA: sigma-70 family RNA polymerase sigma factor [Gemmataceae bacterium]
MKLKPAPRTKPTASVADPEVDLMLRVRCGDEGAYAELVRRYWPRIFGRFFRLLGDRHQAEDLAQEVFLRLYRSRGGYRPEARFATWVYHIAANVARNALRSRRRRPPAPPLPAGAAGGEGPADRREPPEAPLERAELAGAVRGALAGLLGRQRAALELQYDGQRSYREIARELDVTPKAAKSLLYRARNQLRSTLSHLIDTPV